MSSLESARTLICSLENKCWQSCPKENRICIQTHPCINCIYTAYWQMSKRPFVGMGVASMNKCVCYVFLERIGQPQNPIDPPCRWKPKDNMWSELVINGDLQWSMKVRCTLVRHHALNTDYDAYYSQDIIITIAGGNSSLCPSHNNQFSP